MKRMLLAGASVLFLAACAKEEPKPVATGPKIIQPDCQTVTPYKPLKFTAPTNGVPDAFRAFAGIWGGGAWDGYVCHDLYVLAVEDDGDVEVFDAHGPGFGFDATGFRRKGRIDENGRLTVRKGPATVEYWIEDGRMHGVRRHGKARSRIILTRES